MIEDEIVKELSEEYNKREEYIKFLIKICKREKWDICNIKKYFKLM